MLTTGFNASYPKFGSKIGDAAKNAGHVVKRTVQGAALAGGLTLAAMEGSEVTTQAMTGKDVDNDVPIPALIITTAAGGVLGNKKGRKEVKG